MSNTYTEVRLEKKGPHLHDTSHFKSISQYKNPSTSKVMKNVSDVSCCVSHILTVEKHEA